MSQAQAYSNSLKQASLNVVRQSARSVLSGQTYPQQVGFQTLGAGASAVVRPYGKRGDMQDSIWGFSHKIDYINHFSKPEYGWDAVNSISKVSVAVGSFFEEHLHMFVQFDRAQLPNNIVIKETSKGKAQLTATDLIGHMLVFDRFKDNIDVTSLLQTFEGDCPCIVINKSGSIKGILMRRLVPLTTEHIQDLQGLSLKEKSLVFSHVWKFASGLLTQLPHGNCLVHRDIRALSTTTFLSGNMVYDPSARRIIVVDYDSVRVHPSITDDMYVCTSLFVKFAETIQLDIFAPQKITNETDAAQLELFLYYECLKSILPLIQDYNDEQEIIDARWYQLLHFIADNMSRESGCINGNSIFDRSSVKLLEIFVDDKMMQQIQVRLMTNCRMVAISLFLYLQVFRHILRERYEQELSASQSNASGVLAFHCFPRESKIIVKYQNTMMVYKKDPTNAIIDLLVSSNVQNKQNTQKGGVKARTHTSTRRRKPQSQL